MDPRPLPEGMTPPQRAALADAGIDSGDQLLAWAATQVVDLLQAHNDNVRPSAARAEQWLAELVAPPTVPMVDEIERLDPEVLDGWETEASFTVYFLLRPAEDDATTTEAQVLVVRNEHDDEEQAWPGRDCSSLCAWMLDQLGYPAPTGPAPTNATPFPTDDDRRHPMPTYRTYNGTDNGGRDTGRTRRPLLDLGLTSASSGAGQRPNPREISTRICQGLSLPDPFERSEFMWAWGQFLDHELDLIDEDRARPEPITIPDDDPRVEMRSSTTSFNRSKRKQGLLRNVHTAYIDASNVYGPNEELAEDLREGVDGRLRRQLTATNHELLPAADDFGFKAGDIRVNEHCVLIAMHTLWLREHNRLCQLLAAPPFRVSSDEKLYQAARALVGAQMQVITYEEFLPALLGPGVLPPRQGFDPKIDPGISNLFATAAYRLGHSMVGDDLLLADGAPTLPLRDAFFVPGLIHNAGIEPFLYGLPRRPMQAIDTVIVDGLREHLFMPLDRTGPPRVELRDLAMLNIQRGRDHALPPYQEVREHFGLRRVSSFDELTSDSDLAAELTDLYTTPDHCDLWIALLVEEARPPRRLGDLLTEILVDQFSRIRDGDYHWWERDPNLPDSHRSWVRKRRLVDVLRDNTDHRFEASELGPNVFTVN